MKKYIGVPFKERGRDTAGWDCYGLVCYISKNEFGIDIPSYVNDYKSIKNFKHTAKLIEEGKQSWREVDSGSEKPGDVVLIRLRNLPIHVGIMVSKGTFMHVEDDSIGTCVARVESIEWKDRIVGYYRYV